MQKNTIVWLMASCFAVTCLPNAAAAAGDPPRTTLEMLSESPAAANPARLPTGQESDGDPYDILRKANPEQAGQEPEPGFTQSPWFIEDNRLATLLSDQPVIQSATLSENSRQLIRAIRNAPVHGLNPESYDLTQITMAVDALDALAKPVPLSELLQGKKQRPNSDELRQALSARMDLAFARLAKHLGEGVVDARATQRRLFRDPPHINGELLLESVWSGQQTALEALESVTPAQPDYQRLTDRMRNLLTERAAGIERPVIGIDDPLTTSMKHPDVMDVKHRLMESGELPPDTVLTPRFDTELASAVRVFQQRHGLEADGTVGKHTRDALNVSIDDEIRAVALSLERWRWMPRELGEKHLYINIPDYRVVFRDGADTKMSMVAVVGSVEHRTPTFSRDMSYIEFNPTWTVPKSITNRELIPKERRRPGYLSSRQFDFLKRVNNQFVPIPPDEVTTADLNTVPFPYTLRQRGGPMNGLGRIKFMMPNPYSIYLHDTQTKRHFALTERAFSHGCIRLSDPDALARLLMTEDGYSSSAIRKALQESHTHRIRIRHKIPTHLTYMTTWIDDAGTLQRRPDIYEHDAALLIALQASDTLLSTLNPPTASLSGPTLTARSKI